MHRKKTLSHNTCLVTVAALALAGLLALPAEATTLPTTAEPAATSTPAAPASAPVPAKETWKPESFYFGWGVGIATCMNEYQGFHGNIDLSFKTGEKSYFGIMFSASSGEDTERGNGVSNYLLTLGYRYFKNMGNKYALITLGPTVGKWDNTDTGDWIAGGFTLQTDMYWKDGVDWGGYAGLTMAWKLAQNDEVEDELGIIVFIGIKLHF